MHVINALGLMLGIILLLGCTDFTKTNMIPAWVIGLIGIVISVVSVVTN